MPLIVRFEVRIFVHAVFWARHTFKRCFADFPSPLTDTYYCYSAVFYMLFGFCPLYPGELVLTSCRWKSETYHGHVAIYSTQQYFDDNGYVEIYVYRKDDAVWHSAVETASSSSSSSTSQAMAAKAVLPVKEEPSSSTSEAVAVRAEFFPVKEEPEE